MNTALQSVLNQEFLNKRISIPIPERDNRGRIIPNRFVQCTGTCNYIGNIPVYGETDIYIVLDGMPILVRHMNDIVLTPPAYRSRLPQKVD